MTKKLFSPGNDSSPTSAGLLALRLFFGLTMLLHHGLDKLNTFNIKAPHFPDPLGVGHSTSLALTVFAEVIAAILLAIGLWTRFAALVLAFEMASRSSWFTRWRSAAKCPAKWLSCTLEHT